MRRLLLRLTGVAALTAVPALAVGPALSARDGQAIQQRIAGDSLRYAIASRLRSASWPVTLPERQRQAVRTLYDAHAGAALWIVGSRVGARAARLVDALADAHMEGLRLDAYPFAALRAALAAVAAGEAPTTTQLATLDIVLTSAYVAFGDDLLTGQVDPGSVTRAWHIDAHTAPLDSILLRAFRLEPLDSGLAQLRPRDREYDALLDALTRYRALVERGGWSRVPAGNVLRPGDTTSAQRLDSLIRRLRIEGWLDASYRPSVVPSDTTAPVRPGSARVVYDAAIQGAVARYQVAHGLVVDSIVGPNTMASLNRSAEYRTSQVAANLERHRWLPRSRGARHILVNVPAFRLTAFDSGRAVLSMRVIVGAEYGGRATPMFSDSMSYVVFRPYWNVPSSIASRELWPRQRRDPGYFARNDYEAARASWGDYVRQKPGSGNALGLVKFIFPNDFAIYLHDTPADDLFQQDVRAASHGCIRVERPAELAHYVLGWSIPRAEDAMYRGPDDTRIDLDRKLPVYIAYFTTYMHEDGLRFANDIYERDDALVRAMQSAALPSDSTLALAADVRRMARTLTD